MSCKDFDQSLNKTSILDMLSTEDDKSKKYVIITNDLR